MTPCTCAFTITIFLTLSGTSILKIPSASRARVSCLMQLLCVGGQVVETKIYFRFRHSTRPPSCRGKIRAAHFPANV
jgi:hypothetical protein